VARQGAKQAPERGPADPCAAGPTHQEITKMAYWLWQGRGRPQGSPEEDWFNAETALKASFER
jgi:hypothetical protein